MLFVVMLFSYEFHGTLCIQCGAAGHAERVQKIFLKWINPCHPIAQTGGDRFWSCCFGGEEDLSPRRLTAVNLSASVMELYIVEASVAAEATNPPMA